jgi:hypothetical protein
LASFSASLEVTKKKLEKQHCLVPSLPPHFSQKVRLLTPEALQNLGFDKVIALEQKRQCVVRIQLKIIIKYTLKKEQI